VLQRRAPSLGKPPGRTDTNPNWVQRFALGLLAVQSIGWLATLIRIVRLAAETSSASTIIVTLRGECARPIVTAEALKREIL
jgi:hypothetical protein